MDELMVDVETVQTWLEEQRPVVLLDVRPSAKRAVWAIPGSMHIDAYEDLKAGDVAALAQVQLPSNQPIVTICGAGKTSRAAAQHLRERGLPALSLAGGMRAWSLAWNVADVDVRGSTAQVIQVRRTGKGCLSYIIGSGGAHELRNELWLRR